MSCVCPCKEVKFSCGFDPVVNIIEQCNFPSAMSVDFYMSSRSDCQFYYTCYNGGGNVHPGVVDCYDRQKVIDDDVNGTYILSKITDANSNGLVPLYGYSYSGFGTSIPLESLGCLTTGGIILGFSPGISFTLSAVARPADFFNPEMLSYDSAGNTAYLNVHVSRRETFNKEFPKFWFPGQFGNRFIFDSSLTYATNQPITCSGSLAFTHIGTSSNIFVPRDLLGTDDEWTLFPTSLTLTPVIP